MIRKLLTLALVGVAAAMAEPPAQTAVYPATPIEVARAFCAAEARSGAWEEIVEYTPRAVELFLVEKNGVWTLAVPVFDRNDSPLTRILEAKDFCGYVNDNSVYRRKCTDAVQALRAFTAERQLRKPFGLRSK